MAKKFLKFLGYESLYMFLVIVVAAFATFVQVLFRKYIEDYSSFIWSGRVYRYNYFMYALGVCIFAYGIYFLCNKFEKHFATFKEIHILLKIIAVILLMLLAFAMFIIQFATLFVSILGLSNDIGPDAMYIITVIGWPFITVVYTIVKLIGRKKEKAD